MSGTAPGTAVPLVLVIGASGGSGSSLVAGALALSWARGGVAVVLVDLDLERGDIGDAWGLSRERTLADLQAVAPELDANHLRHAAQTHASGVRVVLSAAVPGSAVAWDRPSVGRLLESARVASGDGGRVVVDGGTGLPAAAAAASERASGIVVTCSPTVAAARRAQRLVSALAELRADPPCALVVNHGPVAAQIGARALGHAVGRPVVGELPWAEREGRRLGAGGWPTGRRARLAAAIDALAGAVG